MRLVAIGSEVALIDNLLADCGANPFNVAAIRDRVHDRDRATFASTASGRSRWSKGGAISSIWRRRPAIWARWQIRSTDLDINCRAPALAARGRAARARPASPSSSPARARSMARPDHLPVDEKHPLRPPDVNGIEADGSRRVYDLLYHQAYGIPGVGAGGSPTLTGRACASRTRGRISSASGCAACSRASPSRFGAASRSATSPMSTMSVTPSCWRATVPAAQGRVFNIGAERAVSLAELARLVIEANGGGDFATKSFPPERKRIDIGDYQADDRLFRDATGWRPPCRSRPGSSVPWLFSARTRRITSDAMSEPVPQTDPRAAYLAQRDRDRRGDRRRAPQAALISSAGSRRFLRARLRGLYRPPPRHRRRQRHRRAGAGAEGAGSSAPRIPSSRSRTPPSRPSRRSSWRERGRCSSISIPRP